MHFKKIKFTAVLPEITNKKRKGTNVFQKNTCEIWYSIQWNSMRLLKLGKFVVFQDTTINIKCKIQNKSNIPFV